MALPRPITGNTAATLNSIVALCDAVDPLMGQVADLQAQIAAEIAARQGAVAAAARALAAQIQDVSITANQTVYAEAGYRVAHINQAVASVTAACTALVQAEADARVAGDADAVRAVAAVRARLDGLSRRLAAAEADLGAARRAAAIGTARPGETLDAFTRVAAPEGLAGPRAALAPLGPEDVTPSDAGPVACLIGAGALGMRRMVAIEEGRLYRLRAVIRRVVDTPDPSGDAVRLVIVALDQSLALLPGADGLAVARAFPALSVSDGRQAVEVLFARTPGLGGALTLSPRARFAVGAVVTYGDAATTAVEVLDVADVTGQFLQDAPTAAFEGRLAALEHGDLPARLAVVERAVGTPLTVTFGSKGDAQAGAIPESVQLVALLGRAHAGDGGAGLYARAAGPVAAGADAFTSHGATFVRVPIPADLAAAVIDAGWQAWLSGLPRTRPTEPGVTWFNGGVPSVTVARPVAP